MKEIAVGFDTSNYTTSLAFFDGETGQNAGRLLDVPPGQLGLRQSEALFAHVKRLPEIADEIAIPEDARIIAVGASATPRETEGSYMPCFLAGVSHAKVLAKALAVPYFAFSHQQGHVAAAAWSAGREDLLVTPHLAWHLSGGTTELLFVKPLGPAVICEKIGGTSDLAAGQLIDRTGQLLGLPFPAGREIDRLSHAATKDLLYSPKTLGLTFSISGIEQKMRQLQEGGESPENIAYFTLASVIAAVHTVTKKAAAVYGGVPVLYSGGVASNSLLRERTPDGIFALPRYSTDNAMGCAILTYRAVRTVGA